LPQLTAGAHGVGKMASTLFWNQPSIRAPKRLVDPLGFDALREAMADKLVPFQTDATRSADEYLWTVIGLFPANEAIGSLVYASFPRRVAPANRRYDREADALLLTREVPQGRLIRQDQPVLSIAAWVSSVLAKLSTPFCAARLDCRLFGSGGYEL
jgi:hypothetical protein